MRHSEMDNDPLEILSEADDRRDGEERRRDSRRPLSLTGRYMLADGQEFPCQTVEASVSSIALSGPFSGRIGTHVIAYLGKLGRVEGVIQRAAPNMFVIDLVGDETWRGRFSRRLEEALNEPTKPAAQNSWEVFDVDIDSIAPTGSPFRSIF